MAETKNKKMFVVGINGSSRKNGNTNRFLKIILKSAKKEGTKTVLINLADKNIKPCLGCYSILEEKCKYPCVQKDGMQKIYKLLIQADGIVLGSPSYWFNVSGLIKNFIDRLTCLENSGYLFKGKIGACVSSAEETGGEEVAHYLANVLNEMGCLVPPFATAFFNTKGKESWYLKDLDNIGKNIVKLCRSLKKDKLIYPKFTSQI